MLVNDTRIFLKQKKKASVLSRTIEKSLDQKQKLVEYRIR